MSVSIPGTENQNPNPAPSSGASQFNPPGQGTSGGNPPSEMKFSFGAAGQTGMTGFSALSVGNRSEEQRILVEAMKKSVERYIDPIVFDVKVVAVDRRTYPELDFGAIALVVQVKAHPELNAVYHTLALAFTGLDPKPREYRAEKKTDAGGDWDTGPRVEVPMFVSDGCDARFGAVVMSAVKRVVPASVRVHSTETTVVPRTYPITDPDAVDMLTAHAFNAVLFDLNRLAKAPELDYKKIGTEAQLEVRHTLARTVVKDVVGQPHRADFLTTFRQVPKNNGETGFHVGQTDVVACVTASYVDYVYVDNTAASANPFMPTQPAAQENWTPPLMTRINVSHVATGENVNGVLALSFGLQLSAILQAATLATRNYHRSVYRPRMSNDGRLNLNDIGYANIEANVTRDKSGIGIPVDVKKADFTAQNLEAYMAAIFREGALIALDCVECGPHAYIQAPFVLAANGIPEAHNYILKTMDTLTGGEFLPLFRQRVREDEIKGIFMHMDRVFLGTWQAGTRGLDDIDTLAVAVMRGDKSPMTVRHWCDALYVRDIPEPLREHRMHQLLKAITDDSATTTGRSIKLTFDPWFIKCGLDAIGKTKLVVRQVRDGETFVEATRPAATWAAAGGFGGGSFGVDAYSGSTGGGGGFTPNFGRASNRF